MNLKCKHCGSEKVMGDLKVVDLSQHGPRGLTALVAARAPEALFFKKPVFATLRADICGECGYTALFANNPAELYATYLEHNEPPLDSGDRVG